MSKAIAQSERAALCDLFEDVGPLAPTLCEGWTTADLLAHLFVRESRAWAAGGVAIPALAGMTQRTMDKAKGQIGYEGLIARVRCGPPTLMSPLDSRINVVEYFVHHEDVRRAADPPGTTRDDPALDAVLWSNLRRGGRLLTRKLKGAGLELQAPGFGIAAIRPGEPVATMSGSPQELMLYIFGRRTVADVELEGSEAAKAAVEAASFGM